MKIQNKKNQELNVDQNKVSSEKKTWKQPELSKWDVNLELNLGVKTGVDGSFLS
ncbi:hypothetical protein AQBE111736_00235 [Aquirufa beregesia]|uniref:hypothetical protein n=1 Tax=Aquirufa beregesia TaxID=2516556 RepID=UPI00140BEF2D|nr:hypothetical protein [Aquirufa beregesia]